MKKYFTLLVFIISFHSAADSDITVFGERFTPQEYVSGPWGGPMGFSELPSLSDLGVEQYDTANIALDTERFDLVLDAMGFKKTGQTKKEIPVVIVLYSDQLLMNNPEISFDYDSVVAAAANPQIIAAAFTDKKRGKALLCLTIPKMVFHHQPSPLVLLASVSSAVPHEMPQWLV